MRIRSNGCCWKSPMMPSRMPALPWICWRAGGWSYVGIATWDYSFLQIKSEERNSVDAYTNIGTALCIAANRISYFFNLVGPSLAVDTACSSSLVATHLACRSIWSGESEMAFVGGVNVLVQPEVTIGFSKASMLSPDGRCKSFDSRANGYVRGEGAGVVILKPRARAVADGDQIYALIRATAVNQDGRTAGISFPNRASQRSVHRRRLAAGGYSAGFRAVRRSAWNRDPGRRSHRGGCPRGGVRAGASARRPVRDRLDQEQSRASRGGRGDGRTDQGGAVSAASPDPGQSPFRVPEPADPFRRSATARRAATAAMAANQR